VLKDCSSSKGRSRLQWPIQAKCMLIADTNECFALALVKMPCASDPSFLFRGAEEPVSNILSSQKGILKPVEDALIIAAAELNSRRPPTADRRPPTAGCPRGSQPLHAPCTLLLRMDADSDSTNLASYPSYHDLDLKSRTKSRIHYKPGNQHTAPWLLSESICNELGMTVHT